MFGTQAIKDLKSEFGPKGPNDFQRKLNQLADTKNIDTINETDKGPLNKIERPIPQNEIEEKITDETIHFAEEFGKYLAKSDTYVDNKGKTKDSKNALTTNQLRKFFGEVKRQQLRGYQPTEFILLKPKLAYAVGRADKGSKIADFYFVIAQGIDRVHTDEIGRAHV